MKRILLLIILITTSILTIQAQSFNQIQKLVASDRSTNDFFGSTVAIDGDYAITSSLSKDFINGTDTIVNAGVAYIFKRDANGTWQEIKQLVPSVQRDNFFFGLSIAIEGDYAVVTTRADAIGINDSLYQAGAAYVFKKDAGGTDNWGEIKKLIASDRAVGDSFGEHVSISGDYIAISAIRKSGVDNSGNILADAGAAYIFKKDAGGTDNWGEVKKILPSESRVGDRFGVNLSLSGDNLAVGAALHDVNTANPNDNEGKVYVFNKNEGGADNWGEVQQLIPNDLVKNDQFGIRISSSEEYIVITSQSTDGDTSNAGVTIRGAVYVFKKDAGGLNNWGQIKKLVASDRRERDQFGESISIDNDYIIVGAYHADTNSVAATFDDEGAVYVFQKDAGGTDNWGEIQKIISNDAGGRDQFGVMVRLSGDDLIIGANRDQEDVNGLNPITNAGSIYIFQLNPPTSTRQIIDNANLKIFPNPAQNTLFIENTEVIETVIIYNAIGQPVRQVFNKNTQFSIDVSNFENGFYIIEAKQSNGQIITKPFIKQ